MPGLHTWRRPFYGRDPEAGRIAAVLRAADTGDGGALVVVGEPGIGKSALIEHVLAEFPTFTRLDVVGAEFERELTFAALHQLCAPIMPGAAALPEALRAALEGAFGQRNEARDDRLMVGRAVLALLDRVSVAAPVVCVIDDAQWLDQVSARVLSFVARRLASRRVAFLFAVRESAGQAGAPAVIRSLGGLPVIGLAGLADQHARALLALTPEHVLDGPVQDRVIAEARGNPLALLETAAGEAAGGRGADGPVPLTQRIHQSFLRRLGELPGDSRTALIMAAAEPLGDPALLWNGLGRIGISAAATGPAEDSGLIMIDSQVRFRHPLARSAIYRSASPAELRLVHGLLADVTDPVFDPDRRVWHRARATVGVDEAVAAELARSAGRAYQHGGLWAAAAFLDQASALTGDPARRAARALSAAEFLYQTAAYERTAELLRRAERGPLDAGQQRRARLVRARVALYLDRGEPAMRALLEVAPQLPLPEARQAWLQAYTAALWSGRMATTDALAEVAAAVRPLPSEVSPRALDLLLDALTTLFRQGYAVAVPEMRRAVAAFQADELSVADQPWLWLAGLVAAELWDQTAWRQLADRQIEFARDAGALAVLPLGLKYRGLVDLEAGDFAAADVLLRETAAFHQADTAQMDIVLSAWRGRERQVADFIATVLPDALDRGEGRWAMTVDFAVAVLHNGLGNYDIARQAAERTLSNDRFSGYIFLAHEYIEAAVRCGHRSAAERALADLTARTRVSGTDWAHGIELRSRALLTDENRAEALYLEAIRRLGAAGLRAHLARAELLYGEWLATQSRPADARAMLATAAQRLRDIGALAFADRAERAQPALGPEPDASDLAATALTARELLVARQVATGATTPEVAATLHLSRRTVDAYLRNIFRKLGIRNRHELKNFEL